MATDSEPGQIVIPEGYTLHTENTARVLLPPENQAFLNPVQEFNRDLSVACIRTWSELLNEEKEAKWRRNQERRAKQAERGPKAKRVKTEDAAKAAAPVTENTQEIASENATESEVPQPAAGPSAKKQPEGAVVQYQPYKSVILEALSASGLRSIRYAKEVPLVKYVIANDLSHSAVEAMKRNVEINGLGGQDASNDEPSDKRTNGTAKPQLGKVRVSEADACALMYNHRADKSRVDVVDLDPYGTAAPFIDAAVQCVNDGGLLCVTCTDLAILATVNYPEKCFSNYGGVPVKAEYCHEAALRLVLHTLSTSASRYGRYIQPLLSLSIDFYVRVFVRVFTVPNEVKKALSKTSTYYVCSGCQAFYEQPLGRVIENVHQPSGNVNLHFKAHTGPPVPNKCLECNSPLHVAGPMWSGPIHDTAFVGKVLDHVEASSNSYGTSARMKGMLTVAKEELGRPFYFTPSRIAGAFHCVCPSLDELASALLNAGHEVSRSHASAGSIKTTASYADVYDIMRCWIKNHPVRTDKIAPNSPAIHLLSKEPKTEANFKHHPKSVTSSSKVKILRYQSNPTPYWGPGKKAGSGPAPASGKRKRGGGDDDE
ncbi:N2,N2-dimethylguanosine tRNA methyltransferase [Daedalea quercina L-15889]|uniref:tRNA (guanine(26)-N(2))-dimethyltransferase n=1 Tax=Daedalea quercina L-15889 TaxID=1314783 RepID=A0A165P4B9_9APHY|nr:N2,N2-dimethylguanosine tRNA methyltransferase [Daedalea quercina L-15889]